MHQYSAMATGVAFLPSALTGMAGTKVSESSSGASAPARLW
ncbi:hypothetical protein ACIF8T_36340 [Streptomyces sp. NPDC085946]